MIDVRAIFIWAVGALVVFGLACLSIGLTFGVFIGSAIQSTTGP